MRRRGETMAHSRSTSLLNIWRKLCAAAAILAAAVMAAAADAQTATAIHSRNGGLLIQRPARTWEFLWAAGKKLGGVGNQSGWVEGWGVPLKLLRDFQWAL